MSEWFLFLICAVACSTIFVAVVLVRSERRRLRKVTFSWANSFGEWIRVDDSLPIPIRDVLVYDTEWKAIYTAFYDDENPRWITPSDREPEGEITHWMPYPAHPKEGK